MPPPRRLRPRGDTERASATVEVAVMLPLVMTLLLVLVQAAVFFHSQAVATTAAHKAVDAARLGDGTSEDGTHTAEEFLTQNADGLRDRTVAVHRTGDEATATVSGRVVSVLFGVPMHLTVVVSAPIERPAP